MGFPKAIERGGIRRQVERRRTRAYRLLTRKDSRCQVWPGTTPREAAGDFSTSRGAPHEAADDAGKTGDVHRPRRTAFGATAVRSALRTDHQGPIRLPESLETVEARMTIRAYLARRARWIAVVFWTPLILVLALPRDILLPRSASASMLFAFGFLAAVLLTRFLMRCPVCRVRYGNFGSGSFTSSRPAQRFNHCPGCGIKLDSELRQPI